MQACSGASGGGAGWSGNLLPPAHRASTTLEWHDLDAAVAHVSDVHTLALVARRDDGDARVYDLLTVTDEPVRIRFVDLGRGDPAPAPDEARPADIEVQVGLFGDDAREQAILDTLRDRLDWLLRRD